MMKSILYAACAAAALALTACYEDKGNYDYTTMEPVVIEGIESLYERYTEDEDLVITPRLDKEERYDYCWLLYENVVAQGPIISPDTLSKEKDLEMEFDLGLKPGQYLLVFNARDKRTGYVGIVDARLVVSTINSTGWYFTKQTAQGRVDMDFFYPNGEVRDWMATNNDGYDLAGNVIETSLLSTYEEVPTDGVTTRALMVVTDSDASIFRVADGGVSKKWGEMFYSTPPTRSVQSMFLPTGFNMVGMYVDDQAYSMALGVAAGGGLFAGPVAATGNVCSAAVFGFDPIVFDKASKSFKRFPSLSYYAAMNERADAPVSSNNMNADPVWMEGYPYPRWRVVALMKTVGAEQYRLVEMQTDWMYIMSNQNPIIASYPVAPASRIVTAAVRGGNFDLPVVYLAEDNRLYKYTFSQQGGVETLLWSAPAGETITMAQHVKYPLAPAGGEPYLSTLVVASHKDGRYKVWLHDVAMNGDLVVAAGPAYEGEGMVKCATWLGAPVAGSTNDGSVIYY